MSKWSSHPGGPVIFTHAGEDATDTFASFHTASAYEMLDQYYLGDLDTAIPPSTAFEAEFRALTAKLHAEGIFKVK